MGNERKIYENIVELTQIYDEMCAAGYVKEPANVVPCGSTISGYDELRDDLIDLAHKFEERYPDTEEYLTDIREFAEEEFLKKYGTPLGRNRRKDARIMKVVRNIDWTLFVMQKAWLSRQISELEPTGTEATKHPEGILNMMDALQDAWEGEGEEEMQTVWADFESVPVDEDTGCILMDWRCFREGTDRRDIIDWFVQVYGTAAYDLF